MSVCAGIEAASVAWHELGWTPVAFSEIEPFPCAVLKHHYPDVPNWGDMTKFKEWPDADVVVLVGGTPCQSFSVAGLRHGLNDPRGNLMLTFLGIAGRYRPKWIVWENVPGVLSSNGGRDFGTFLTALGELGYGWAYRVLDARWFGVAQRRKRVFVIGCLGDQRSAAQVLFEHESVCRDFEKSREARQTVAETFNARTSEGGGFSTDFEAAGGLIPEVCGTLSDGAHYGGGLNGQDAYSGRVIPTVVGALAAKGPEAMGAPEVDAHHSLPITFGAQMSAPQTDVDMVQMLQATNPMAVALPVAIQGTLIGRGENAAHAAVAQPISYDLSQVTSPVNHQNPKPGDPCHTLAKETAARAAIAHPMQVRRLTPVECERLQGFPDGYTAIPWRNKPAEGCPDGPRYKALGNSMAVPVIRWLGERIQRVDDLLKDKD